MKQTLMLVSSLTATAFVFSAISQAYAKADGGFQIGAAVGALSGVSGHIGYRFSSETSYLGNRFGVRVEYATLAPLKSTIEGYELEIEEQKFNMLAKGNQLGALIDFYPFGGTWGLGNFRVSGGYYKGKFEMGAKTSKDFGTIGEDFEFSDVTYKVKGSANLMAAINSKATGPYLGVGFDIALIYGLKLFADAGLVFTKEPTIETSITGNGTIEYTILGTNHTVDLEHLTPAEQLKLDKVLSDMKSQFDEELKQLKKPYFPMAKVGLLYRF